MIELKAGSFDDRTIMAVTVLSGFDDVWPSVRVKEIVVGAGYHRRRDTGTFTRGWMIWDRPPRPEPNLRTRSWLGFLQGDGKITPEARVNCESKKFIIGVD